MSTTGVLASNIKALDSGYFKVGNEQLTFADLVLLVSINALKSQDKTFKTMFKETQERSKRMNLLNDCIQMLNTYKKNFDKDGKATDKGSYKGSSDKYTGLNAGDKKKWLEVYRPQLAKNGLVKDAGIGSDGYFSKKELNSFLENAKLAQTNLSSTNEQQMLRTNQAATKRSTILQQIQTLLSAAKDASNAAAR